VRRRVWLWVLGLVVGGGLIAVPDDDARVFSVSEGHGPALVDLAGMLIVTCSWLPSVTYVIGRRSRLTHRTIVLLLAGGALLGVTVGFDLGLWWVAAAGLAFAGNVSALVDCRGA
jgi:hypothetical protein